MTDPTPPLVVDAKALAKLLNSGLRTVRALDAAGKLPAPIRLGGRVLWLVNGPNGIGAWLEAGAPKRDDWESRKASPKTRKS